MIIVEATKIPAELLQYFTPVEATQGTVWDITTRGFPDAHFATFPEQLVETPIKAGCPEFVCVKCGVNRESIVDVTYTPNPKGGYIYAHRGHPSKDGSEDEKKPSMLKNATKIGLTDCGCNVGFQPGLVLDPFFGSGTVGVVAMKLGRNFLGIELSQEYIRMAEKRLAPLLAQQRLPV